MNFYGGSVASGISDALDTIQQRKSRDLQLKYQQLQYDQTIANQSADAAGADALTTYLASIASPTPAPGQASQPAKPPQGIAPPPQGGAMPQPPQGGMQPPPPMQGGMMRTGMPMQGAPGAQSGPAVQRPPQMPQPTMQRPAMPAYTNPMQSPAGAQPQGPAGMVAPPPQPAVPDPSKMPAPAQMAADLKKQGIAPAAIVAALKSYMPLYENAQRDQIKDMEIQLKAQQAAELEYFKTIAAAQGQQKIDQKGTQFDEKEGRLTKNADLRYGVEKEKADAASLKAQKYMTGHSGGTVPASAVDVDSMAHAVAGYQVDIRSLSTKGGYREKVLSAALKLNPEYDQKEYAAENAFNTSGSRTAGTQGANAAIASEAASGGADILVQAFGKLGQSTMPLINKILSGGRAATGDPAQAAVETALNTFVNEYGRAVNPKGVATVSDKAHIREILSTADSQQTFAARMDILRQEMARGVKAPKTVAEQQKRDRLGQGNKPAPSSKVVDWSDLK